MFKKVFGTANKYIENIFNKDSNDSNSNDISLINELPDEILEQIFLRLSAIDLTKKVNLVCKKWNFLIKNNEFWIQKSIHDKKLTKQKLQLLNERQIGWNAKKIILIIFSVGIYLKTDLLKIHSIIGIFVVIKILKI